MNKDRRKDLEKATELLNEAKDIIENCLSDEENYRDEMPENLQSSEKYEKADSACNELTDAVLSIEDAIQAVETASE